MTGSRPITVLLVEDSPPMRELLSTVLRRGRMEVRLADCGAEALHRFGAERPDVVVLDLHLPDMSGLEVLAALRERSEVPILMLTALADEGTKVRALNGGADDYVVKPAGAAELTARVAALVRRARRVASSDADIYDDGLVRVDFPMRRASVAGSELSLTPLEYRLLSAFVRHPGATLSRDDLLREVWHDASGGPSEHVKIYVGYLRRKLAAVTGEELIATVRGFGYRWLRSDGAEAQRRQDSWLVAS